MSPLRQIRELFAALHAYLPLESRKQNQALGDSVSKSPRAFGALLKVSLAASIASLHFSGKRLYGLLYFVAGDQFQQVFSDARKI